MCVCVCVYRRGGGGVGLWAVYRLLIGSISSCEENEKWVCIMILCQVYPSSTFVRACVCVCVGESGREGERERERASEQASMSVNE